MQNRRGLQLKMLLIMALAAAITLTVSGAALYRAWVAMQRIEEVSRRESDLQQAINAAHLAYRYQVNDWKNTLVRSEDEARAATEWKKFLDREQEVDKLARRARAMADAGEVGAQIDAFLENHKRVGELYRSGYARFVESKFNAVEGNRVTTNRNDMPDEPLTFADQKAKEHAVVAIREAKSAGAAAFMLAIAAIAAAMLAAGIAVWFFLRSRVLAPISAAVAAADRIASGDLTVAIHSTSGDEMGQLLEALARMNASLTRVVSTVRDAAEGVLAASTQVAAGTTDLSQRTDEQASSLEETAASMEELASTVRQNAEAAREADRLSDAARGRAEQGGGEVALVVKTMQGISDSAKRIADIISVIDGIAFQTNILALNAAVEAARAGEQGRGFAVVASEVRALAQRSAQAAKEIKDLIGASVEQVGKGATLVAKTGATIEALVGDVKSVNELMGSIAEASEEQSRGVQQVNKTVTEMDQVVQQNAHAVQESASAAEKMRHQADALIAAVRTFRTDGDSGTAPAEPPARRTAASTVPRIAPSRPPAAMPAKQKAQPAPAMAGEDWEEF